MTNPPFSGWRDKRAWIDCDDSIMAKGLDNKDYQPMDCKSEGIHRVADILPGFGPGDVGSIPTGSVQIIETFFY